MIVEKSIAAAFQAAASTASKRNFFHILHDHPSAAELFGSLGSSLLSFNNDIDRDHPDLANVLDGSLSADSEFCKQTVELSRLLDVSKQESLGHAREILCRSIRFPCNNIKDIFTFARFFKKSEDRLRLRQAKTSKEIYLSSFLAKEKMSAWYDLPWNFESYFRHSDAIERRLEDAKLQVDRFQKLGCKSMSSLVEESLSSIKIHSRERFLGFQRITMTNAALILAKSRGFYLDKRDFGDSRFVAPEEFATNCGAKSHILHPAVHPFDSSQASSEINTLVNHLEALPEFGNRPAFDYIAVVCFGFCKDLNNSLELLYSGKVPGIILGERDRKCYFISYWR